MRKPPITAAELEAQLISDPEWVKRKADQDTYWKAVRIRYAEEEKPLIAELKTAGVDVSSLEALVERSEPYPLAIPILLTHLRLPYSENIREMIARSLAVPDAAYAHDELVGALRQEVKVQPQRKIRGVVQGIACAVAASTTEENIPSLIALMKDESLGDDRLLFLRRLKKSKRPDAAQVLSDLATDPVFSREIQSWRRTGGNKKQ